MIALTGFMGTGKTSVGKRLAERLGWPFVDTDVIIERREGRSVADIFAGEGESYFRARESEAIAEATAKSPAVIATGGGAILDPANFDLLQRATMLVCLTATPEVILARTRGHGRPLLESEDRGARVRQLLASRAAAYARAPHSVDTSRLSVEEVVEHVLALHRSEETPAERQ